MKKMFQPKFISLQWHITERCNWRCKHCYQENYSTPELDIEEMEKILIQFVALIKKWKLPRRSALLPIMGGEPLLRKDFFSFLEIVKKYSDYFYWTVASNGSLLTEDIAKRLKALGISYLQVSLEGTEEINDEVRGKGSFQKAIEAIRLLNLAKIPIRVSLTISKQNFSEMRKLAHLLVPLGVSWLGVRRIVPFGSKGDQLENLVLEPQELRHLYREIEEVNKELREKKYGLKVLGGCENAIFNDEISSPGLMTHANCGVIGGKILTLMPDGDVLICRRLPIKIGNVLKKSLEEIYYSPLYENLRGENDDIPLECYPCPNVKSCLGGAKCVTYALTGKTAPDVQCWKLFRSLSESIPYIRHQNWFKKFVLFLKVLRSLSFFG